MNVNMRQQGVTLVELIVVIVITGILGGVVAIFLRTPVQGYVDSARRAEMTDIADTAVRRISRELREALPNSVRVTGAISGPGSCNGTEICYLEFLPTSGGGRYRIAQDCSTGTCTGDILDFKTASDNAFDVLGPPVAANAGNYLVIDNMGIATGTCNPASGAGLDAYEGCNRRAVVSGGNKITFTATAYPFPFDSPGHRFQIVSTPVTYICAPATSGNDGSGSLTRWSGYAIQAGQPTAKPATAVSALLANKVSACSFTYDPNVVAQRSGLVTMRLAIRESGETVSLYSAAHVNNEP